MQTNMSVSLLHLHQTVLEFPSMFVRDAGAHATTGLRLTQRIEKATRYCTINGLTNRCSQPPAVPMTSYV
jgi:hypothetical protein